MRPHQEAVAILCERKHDDVLDLSENVVAHFDRIIELRDVRAYVEWVVERPRACQKDRPVLEDGDAARAAVFVEEHGRGLSPANWPESLQINDLRCGVRYCDLADSASG